MGADAAALQPLRDALRDADFAAACRDLAREGAVRAAPPRLRRAAMRLALDDALGEPRGVLLFLFQAAGEIDRARLAAVLPGLDLNVLAAHELVRRHGERVVPLVRIDDLEGLLVCSELDAAAGDAVMGLAPSTLTAAAYTPVVAARAALDLGTGGGALALLAARHAQRVVATDVNPRALALAGRNAALNGLLNVELHRGSLFGPVAGEAFDLVVANPPYVLGPDERLVYRDSGAAGEELSRAVLAGAPRRSPRARCRGAGRCRRRPPTSSAGSTASVRWASSCRRRPPSCWPSCGRSSSSATRSPPESRYPRR
jgi:hypothetical protein